MTDVVRPKFTLSLLTRFELTGPAGPVELANKKLAGLLAYLACTAPLPQPRQKLATLLWGSHFDTQAQQNLRQALFRLRRTLGPDAVMSDGDKVWLAHGVIDCDVARLKTLSAEGSPASLAAAADLYQGALLADLNIAEEAWADWLGVEGRRLEGLALDAMIAGFRRLCSIPSSSERKFPSQFRRKLRLTLNTVGVFSAIGSPSCVS